MKRMTSNEYNPCFNCNFYSSCSHIRENFPVCPERARYDRLVTIEDILGDEYDLNLVQRLIQAYKEGRYIIMKEPEQAGVSRLRELAEADREGKIPKYTIGDTIYDKFGDAWEVTAVERCLLAGEPKWIYRCGHIGTNDYCALWEFEVLTRAEAQAALRREQE